MAVGAALTLQGVHCAVVQVAAADVASVDQLIQCFLQASCSVFCRQQLIREYSVKTSALATQIGARGADRDVSQ